MWRKITWKFYQKRRINLQCESVEEFKCSYFKLYPEGLTEEQYKKALDVLSNYMHNQKKNFLGYQVNNNMSYGDRFKQYLDVHINNVGDPFVCGNLTTNTKFLEQAVLDYYANLWNAVTPHNKCNPESYWGYTLSTGSTEGNVFGIWNARDYLGGKVLLIDDEVEEVARIASEDGIPKRVADGLIYQQAETPQSNANAYTPIAFYSQDTHYSIVKAMRVLNFKSFYDIGIENYQCPLKYPDDYPEGFSSKYLGKNQWPLEVPSNIDGSIHIPSLAKLVEFFVKEGHPIFSCFNYGTTFKGAYDDIETVVSTLVPILKENNMYEREVMFEHEGVMKKSIRKGFWFHVDGALGAAYMPFVEKAVEEGRITLPANYQFPQFDFRIPEINSIVMSGHKWIGAPFSCGVYMTKIKYQLLPPEDPMYIGSPDSTFAGSRNGLVPIMLWDYAARYSYELQVEKAIRTEALAQYAVDKLKELEYKLQKDLWVERSPLSLTIRFRKPNDRIVFKYSISSESLYVYGKKRSYGHIFTMEHVTEELLDQLIEDLSRPDAFLHIDDL